MKTRTVSKWVIGVIAAVVLIGVVGLYCFSLLVSSRWKGVSGIAARCRRSRSQRDGDFGDQPPLFALAQGIVRNDPEAIRATAKVVPDLQAAGRYGETLLDSLCDNRGSDLIQRRQLKLCFRLEQTRITRTVIEPFAMANAGHSSAVVLRAMLEAGGNMNTRDEFGPPMILMN